MKEKNIRKKAIVLLFAAMMLFSSGAVLANTDEKKLTMYTTEEGTTSPRVTSTDVAWDNGVGFKVGMLAAQLYPGDIDAFPADDFKLDATYSVDSVFWQGGYYNCQYAEGPKDYNFAWNITFYNNNVTGDKPGTVYKEYSFPNASIVREPWYETSTSWRANYTVTLSPPIKFYPDTKYWICIYAYNLTWPQSGWCRHNESVGGIKLHEGMFKSESFGFLDWINTSNSGLLGSPNDFNFQLFGTLAPSPVLEITTIKGGFGVSATIKNTGDGPATSVNWSIKLLGGAFIGKETTGTIASIAAGATATTKSKLILGFGSTTITVDAKCAEGSEDTKSASGFVFLFFVLRVLPI